MEPATRSSLANAVKSLMVGPVGQTRKRGIETLAKRKNISLTDARFNQAVRIAQSQQRKQNG